jgi:hypothetical protein
LYGSFTGLGLYRFFHHQLNPITVVLGAAAFMFICTFLALRYAKNEEEIKSQVSTAITILSKEVIILIRVSLSTTKNLFLKLRVFLTRIKG